MVKFPGANPVHPAVDWDTVIFRNNEQWVQITCPVCQGVRFNIAKSVRLRIKKGLFTGHCRRDAHVSTRSTGAEVEHPAVDWHTLRIDRGAQWVTVRCEVCCEKRDVLAKSVRSQLKREAFTGLCRRDRLVRKERRDSPDKPYDPGVDWDDVEIVVENGARPRRRTMVRVHCPDCPGVRLMHPSYLGELIRAGTFRPECKLHRRQRRRATAARATPARANVNASIAMAEYSSLLS